MCGSLLLRSPAVCINLNPASTHPPHRPGWVSLRCQRMYRSRSVLEQLKWAPYSWVLLTSSSETKEEPKRWEFTISYGSDNGKIILPLAYTYIDNVQSQHENIPDYYTGMSTQSALELYNIILPYRPTDKYLHVLIWALLLFLYC